MSTVSEMTYWDLRKMVSRILPRMTQLTRQKGSEAMVREKGRKKNYQQYNLRQRSFVKQERLLNETELNTFLEISIRAQACPMPLNLDVWDGLTCPYKCKYCYANAFRASLYTAFFDNSKSIGLRHCNPDFYKRELEAVMKLRGTDPHSINNDRQKAVAMEIPMRFGIRFEDFMPREKQDGISLQLLQYLASVAYPVMINTKSALVGSPDYVEALASNSAGAAVHVTMISSNESLLERLEPGAPAFRDRLQGCANMVAAGIRVVSRIEPYLLFVNDSRAEVEDWMEQVWAAGVRNITFDTYSYSADNSGIRQAFINEGIDYERLFTAGADSQALGSLLLGKFMDLFRGRGFKCSTFDLGNAASNDQAICCEVGDWFKGGWNYGCTVMAAQLIKERGGAAVSWKTYEAWVNEHGGFLSEGLKMDVKRLWNLEGNNAYSPNWCCNIEAVGHDEDGLIWKYNNNAPDFREELVKGLL